MTPVAWWEGLSSGSGPGLLLGPLAVSFPRSMGAKNTLLCLRVELPHGLCVASLQGWSSFATGASRFASAAKEGVSTRPATPQAGQPGVLTGLQPHVHLPHGGFCEQLSPESTQGAGERREV